MGCVVIYRVTNEPLLIIVVMVSMLFVSNAMSALISFSWGSRVWVRGGRW